MKKNERTKEEYVEAIKSSKNYAEALRKLNIVAKGGNYRIVKIAAEKYGIDLSHFTREAWNKGKKIEKKKLETEKILVKNSAYQSYKLKNRLLKEGIKECRCERCQRTEWEGKPIPLELHHINGINNDNRLENLQMLCPNCHAQTDNYRGKNK